MKVGDPVIYIGDSFSTIGHHCPGIVIDLYENCKGKVIVKWRKTRSHTITLATPEGDLEVLKRWK